MKRYGNLYSKICDMDNLREAHRHARRNKHWYAEVQQVDTDSEKYLKDLQTMLLTHTYDTSEYVVFDRKEGKKVRQIYKLPYFPDRICQWAILQVIEPIFISKLTKDTYSAIPKRGIHQALGRLKSDLRKDPEGTKYCLKLDVRKYYPSINHDCLKQVLRTIFKDEELLDLLGEIIDSTPGDTGIPIGNYMSQWYGNIYLYQFDHYVKEVLGVKHYYRYMDDMVFFAETKEELYEIFLFVDNYLRNRLKLGIKDNWQIFPTAVRGVDFLGYRIFPDYILLRKTTAKNIVKRVNETKKTIESSGKMTRHQWCSLNSYEGWLKWCDSYRFKQKYIEPLRGDMNKFYEEMIQCPGSMSA